MSEWTERPQDIENNDLPEGDIGGDIQRSNAWGRRFTRRNGDGTWDVLTIAFYTAADSWDSVAPAYIEKQTEIVTCTDPDDPGSTELRSEYDYAIVANAGDDYPITEGECRRLRDALTPADLP